MGEHWCELLERTHIGSAEVQINERREKNAQWCTKRIKENYEYRYVKRIILYAYILSIYSVSKLGCQHKASTYLHLFIFISILAFRCREKTIMLRSVVQYIGQSP